jgi:hypothetical protein
MKMTSISISNKKKSNKKLADLEKNKIQRKIEEKCRSITLPLSPRSIVIYK